MPEKLEVIDWYGNTRYIVLSGKNGYYPLKNVTGVSDILIGALFTFYQNNIKIEVS